MTSTSDPGLTTPLEDSVDGSTPREGATRVETTTATCEPAAADSLVLTPKLDQRWAPGPWHALLVAICCVFFLVLDYLPLRSSELWGNIAYGEWILEHGKLPTEDPFMALAEGMRVVDSEWLTQILFALVARTGRQDALCDLFAVTVTLTFLLLGWTYYRQTGLLLAAAVGAIVVLLIAWSQLTTLRPGVMGGLCFAGLLWLIVSSHDSPAVRASEAVPPRDRWPLRLWIGVPVLLALWANLHRSFICGLAVLGCYFLGHVIEVAWRTRSVRGIYSDRVVRRWLFLSELGVVATLVTPYGIDLWLELFWFADRRNLRDIVDWQPLSMLSTGGCEFALSIAVLMVVLRHSRCRVPVAHGLLLAGFAAAAVAERHMLVGYASVFGLVLTPHLAELWARFSAWRAERSQQPTVTELAANDGDLPPGRSWKLLLVCGLLVWIAFALSGLSRPLLGGKSRTPEQLYGNSVPLGVTKYLRENPPNGQVFSSHLWGDWLVADGPPDLKPFITSQIQYAPRQVWQDYRRVTYAQADWEGVLNRYRLNTLVVDKERQPTLVGLLRTVEDWSSRYEDEQAMVVARVRRPDKGIADDGEEASGGKTDKKEAGGAEANSAETVDTVIDTPQSN